MFVCFLPFFFGCLLLLFGCDVCIAAAAAAAAAIAVPPPSHCRAQIEMETDAIVTPPKSEAKRIIIRERATRAGLFFPLPLLLFFWW